MNPEIQVRSERVVKEFVGLSSWEKKYKRIIERGRELSPMEADERVEKNQVKGCQSQVWLVAKKRPDGTIEFSADSDALIVRGLITLLLEVYNRQKPEAITESPPTFLKEIGLDSHLSPSRANGLQAMWKQIYYTAKVISVLD